MLEHLNIKNSNYIRNAPVDVLIDNAVNLNEGVIGHNGALMVDTGEFSGRIPKDKFIVEEDSSSHNIWWGDVNHPISEENFDYLYNKVIETYNNLEKDFYVFDGFAGDDKKNKINVRMLTKKAWQSLFVNNMFIRPEQSELEEFTPDFTIINAFDVKEKDWKNFGLNSENFIIFNIKKKVAIIGGTEYAGEMKKGIFSIMHYYLPLKNVLSMHCSANVSKDLNESALFFGLSGTGKTTLSTNANRPLIGDDEHGWSDDGIFNFEGGCYAKCIDLSEKNEPVIWKAIKSGSIIENVVLDDNGVPDYADVSLTQNSRCCYPRSHVEKSIDSNNGPEPSVVIFLTCDLTGVLPPVSILNKEAAAYHFLSGYTAKVGSTEVGSTSAIESTFSTCFGAPFFPRPAGVYADLLIKRIESFGSKVYLVNTGWTGGPHGTGERFSIPTTRRIINAIQNGELINCECNKIEGLNLTVPTKIDGIDSKILNPIETWKDQSAYEAAKIDLIAQFEKNFQRFSVRQEIVQAGPSL